MTIKADHADVCWEPINVATGQGHWHDQDRWPHYSTRAACAEAIAELHRDRHSDDDPLLLVAAPCFAVPCVVIACDAYGCGEQFDYEGDGGMHFDPADPMPVPITDCEWSIEERPGRPDRHYCPDHRGGWCDDCGEQHHDDCPASGWQPVPVIDGQLSLLGGEA